jgi:hypothetical protein
MSSMAQQVDDIRDRWYQKAKANNTFNTAKDEYTKPTGTDHEERWLVTNKKFKPLRDLLAQSKDSLTKRFDEWISSRDGVQQFVMSPEIAYEVQVLTKNIAGKTEDIRRLLPKAMPPYPRICVEMPLTEPIRAMRSPITHEYMMQVQRIGAYIESTVVDDKTYITFSPYYEFVSGYVNFSTITLTYKNNEVMQELMPLALADYDMTWNAMFHPVFFAAAEQNGMTPEKLWRDETVDLLKAMSVEAVEEIPSLFFSWLVLINSKSGVTKTKVAPIVPHPKLGKRERARRGRSAYTIVSLSDTEDVGSDGLVTLKHVTSAHRVRGHFKARKWGVYWWRPHVRGVGELKEREAYKLFA